MKVKLAHLVSAVLVGFFAACAQAAEYHIDNVTDLTNRVALAANGDVLYLAEGTYDLSGCVGKAYTYGHLALNNGNTLRFRGEPGVQREKIVLKGNGNRIIYLNKGLLEVTGITLMGGTSGSGAAISLGNTNDSGCALTNCVFIGNTAVNGDGGALAFNASSSSPVLRPRLVHNCAFVDNKARYGGAIYGPFGVFTDCAFTNNVAKSGGVGYGGLRFDGCKFFGNCNDGTGDLTTSGSFISWYQETTFSNCRFECNSNVVGSVALFSWGTSYGLTVTNCTFKKNSANGTLFVSMGKGASAPQTYDSVFEENESTGCLSSGPGLFERCLFLKNVSGYDGCQSAPLLNSGTYVNCLVLTNTAFGSHNNSVLAANVYSRNCTFAGNVKRGVWYQSVLGTSSVAVNSAFVANRPNLTIEYGHDVSLFTMTNCVWTSQGMTNATSEARLAKCSVNGRLIEEKKMKFSPECAYLPLYGSPLRDTGYSDETYLSSVGDKDRAGNARVMFNGIDVGSYECQKMPGLLLLVR